MALNSVNCICFHFNFRACIFVQAFLIMANPVRTLLQQLRQIRTSLPVIVREEIIAQRELIARLNRGQLRDGRKADNTRTPFYVENSRSPSAPGRIQLLDMGDFHRGITPTFSSSEFTLTGTDRKTELLVGIYGNILGLNNDSIKVLQDIVVPRVQQRIRQVFR